LGNISRIYSFLFCSLTTRASESFEKEVKL
jgi:hypothetical protein